MFIDLGRDLIPFLALVAFLVFVWGVARFIRASGDEKDFKDRKKFLVWGIVAMFVLVTIWGIISFIKDEFGLDPRVVIPLLPTR